MAKITVNAPNATRATEFVIREMARQHLTGTVVDVAKHHTQLANDAVAIFLPTNDARRAYPTWIVTVSR